MSSRSSVSSLFEDLDPDSSPIILHIEKKLKAGEKLTEKDFEEPYFFKKKMEKEFDDIAEKFQSISIENPEEIISVASDEDIFMIEIKEVETNVSSEIEFPFPETLEDQGGHIEADYTCQNIETGSQKKNLLDNQKSKNLKTSLFFQLIYHMVVESFNYCV